MAKSHIFQLDNSMSLKGIDMLTQQEQEGRGPKPDSCESKAKRVRANCEFRFVNLLGTQDQDEDVRSEVKSHVMRRVWKKHKDSQANWIKRRPPLRMKDASTPKSDITPEGSSVESPDSQYRPNLYSNYHLGKPIPLTPSVDMTLLPASPEEDSSTDHSTTLIPSGYCYVSPRLAAYIFGSDTDPFGDFPIPLMPRLHRLIHQSEEVPKPLKSERKVFFSQVPHNRHIPKLLANSDHLKQKRQPAPQFKTKTSILLIRI